MFGRMLSWFPPTPKMPSAAQTKERLMPKDTDNSTKKPKPRPVPHNFEVKHYVQEGRLLLVADGECRGGPADMIEWLAEQYGVERPKGDNVLHITAGELNAPGGRDRIAGRAFDKVKVDETVAVRLAPQFKAGSLAPGFIRPVPSDNAAPEGAPRDALFQWDTRQDFIAAVTAALCVTGKPNAYDHDDVRPTAPAPPTEHARRIADVLQTLKSAAPAPAPAKPTAPYPLRMTHEEAVSTRMLTGAYSAHALKDAVNDWLARKGA